MKHMMTFKEQAHARAQYACDALINTILACAVVVLCVVAFMYATDAPVSVSTICTQDGTPIAHMQDDAPLQDMRASWCE
jgi:hypothetical protein